MTTTSPSAEPSASPGWQRPAEVRASCSATVTSAQRVAAAASAMAMTSSPKRRAGSATAMAASPCTGERVGTTPTSRPTSRARVAAREAIGGEVGVVGQDDDLVGGGGEDLLEDVVLGDAVGPAGHDADALAGEEVGEPVAGDDGDDGARARRRVPRAGPGPAG